MEHTMSYSKIKQCASSYDVISFSLWDTLIARCVMQPKDVFSITAKRIGISDRRFSRERAQAANIARKCIGKNASLEQIYQVLEELFHYSTDQIIQLKEAELQTELDISVPRLPVVQLMLELLQEGKHVCICCDSCLRSEEIRKLLIKCGISPAIKIWTSCEIGATKDQDTFWRELLASSTHGRTFVHIDGLVETGMHPLNRLGQKVIHIPSGIEAFMASPTASYLNPFLKDDLACSLFMGYFIQKACFNSPFSDCERGDSAIDIWMGTAFACFMDYLVSKQDSSLLLFVTREGYLLQSMYIRYCAALGISPQENTLFYASRNAVIATSVVSKSTIRDALQISYSGKLGHLLKNRFNFNLATEDLLYDQETILPRDADKVMELLKPYLGEIIANGKRQKEAYIQYIHQINPHCRPMSVVDIGYQGTIQYFLSQILSESVSGRYMYLIKKTLPETIGCDTDCLRRARNGFCPIFDNLLFLEAAMQVPFGQFQQMYMEDGKLVPIFNKDPNMSAYIPIAHEKYIRFTEWSARWKRLLGDSFRPDFSLAESMWVVLLKFNYLPKTLLDSFWLTDDFAGIPLWKYDTDNHIWISQNKSIPLNFTLLKAGTRLSLKQRLKHFVKKYIPVSMYAWAEKIWIRYFQ